MKILKYLLLILFLASASTYAQKYRFKTSSFMVSNKDKKGNWGEWSKPEKSKMIVLLDMESHRIVVYSEVIQLFTILGYDDPKTNDEGSLDTFHCVDNDGEKCILTIRTDNKSKQKQLYIREDSRVLVYNMKYIK